MKRFMADRERRRLRRSTSGAVRLDDTKRGMFWSWSPHVPNWDFDIDRLINPYVPRSQTHRLPEPLKRFLGCRDEAEPDVGNVLIAFWSCVGAFCGLTVIGALFRFAKSIHDLNPPVIVASLGAAAILDYNIIRSPLAQPRAAILGHTLAAVTGVGLTKLFLLREDYDSIRWIVGPFICGVSSAVMTLTNTVHPPGGATALLAAVDPTVMAMGWWFVPLILLGSTLMLVVALLVNNIQRQYPVFWWTDKEVGRPELPDDEEKRVSIVPRELSWQLPVVVMSRFSLWPQLLLERRPMITLSCDEIELPAEFIIEPDEEKILVALQGRLKNWAQNVEVAAKSCSDISRISDYPPDEDRPATQWNATG